MPLPTTMVECKHGYDLCPECDRELLAEVRVEHQARKAAATQRVVGGPARWFAREAST
jgi:hypothetical protein